MTEIFLSNSIINRLGQWFIKCTLFE